MKKAMHVYKSPFGFGDKVSHKANSTTNGIVTAVLIKNGHIEYSVAWATGSTDWRSECEIEHYKEKEVQGFQKGKK